MQDADYAADIAAARFLEQRTLYGAQTALIRRMSDREATRDLREQRAQIRREREVGGAS